MKKFFFLYFFLIIINKLTISNNEQINITLTDETEANNPDVCNFTDNENNTIYYYLTDPKYMFILNYIDKFIVDNKTIQRNKSIVCNDESITEKIEEINGRTCGYDNPKKPSECADHSSKDVSCCYIKDTSNGKTDCILALYKMEHQKELSLEPYQIICSGKKIEVEYIMLILMVIIVF